MAAIRWDGLGGLIIITLILIVSCFYCCVVCTLWRKRRSQGNDQRHSHSMIYSVTMQGANSATFNNSVNEYLRNSQNDSERTSRQRQLYQNSMKDNILTPKGLPSYDDVISGTFDGNIEPPPPYSDATENSSGAVRQQP